MNLNDLAANVLQHQRSTPDLIAEALRQAILHGIFEEGQSLRQDEIATKFGVSRIPVREALRQLEAEGLVEFYPNRGATVTTLSSAEAQEIFEIRGALEAIALEIAVPNLTEADLQKAGAVLEAIHGDVSPVRQTELNWEFHETLYTAAQRPRLLGMIKNLHINIDRYVRLQLLENDYRAQDQKEHRQLFDACKQKDADAAVEILTNHIKTAGEQLASYLNRNTQNL